MTVLSNSPKPPETLATQQFQNNSTAQAVREGVIAGSLDGLGYLNVTEPAVQILAETTGNVARDSVEVLANTPTTAGNIVESFAEITGSALESVPEIATVIFEVTGEVAGGMAEVLAEVIGALLSS